MTVRARNTPGIVVGRSASPTAVGVVSAAELTPRSARTTSGTNSSLLARLFSSESRSTPCAAAAGDNASGSVIGGRLSTTFQSTRTSRAAPSASVYPTTTHSSSGGSWMINGRRVRDSRPRARLAAVLLPAKRPPLIATALAIGVPFQCVTSTPGPKWSSDQSATVRVTR